MYAFFPRLFVFVLFFSVSGLLFGQAPNETDAPTKQDEFLEAVQRLSNKSFRVREAAENSLWKMGPGNLPELAKLEKSADLETRTRIQRIREKFAMGLTPDLPANAANLIVTLHQARDGKKQGLAAGELVRQGYLDHVLNFLDRNVQAGNPVNQAASQIIAALDANTPVSKSLDDMHFRLLEMGIKNPKAGSALVKQVTDSSYFRKRDDDAWVDQFLKTLAACPVRTRFAFFLKSASFSPKLRKKLGSSMFLGKWIDLVAEESVQPRQQSLIKMVCSVSQFKKVPMGGDKEAVAPLDVTATMKKLSRSGKLALLEFVLISPEVMSKLHDDLGDEALLEICEATSGSKHFVMGKLAAIPSWPKDKERNDFLQLNNRASEPTEKQQLIRGFLYGLRASGRERTDDRVSFIVQTLLDGESAEWQLPVLLVLFSEENRTLERLSKPAILRVLKLVKNASKSEFATLTTLLARQNLFAREISKHGLQVEFLRSIRDRPTADNTDAIAISSLVQLSDFTVGKRRELMEFCRAKESSAIRLYCAAGIARNADLLEQLIKDGYFMEALNLTDVAGQNEAIKRQFTHLERQFLASKPAIEFLTQPANTNQLIALLGLDLKVESLVHVLTLASRSDSVSAALIENEHWDKVVQAIDSIKDQHTRDSLKQNLVTSKGFALNLVAQRKVVQTLKALSKNESWMGKHMYLIFFRNLPSSVVTAEPDVIPELLSFADTLKGNHRLACLDVLLGKTWFIEKVFAQDRWEDFVTVFKKDVSERSMDWFFRAKAQAKGSYDQIANGKLNELLLLASMLSSDAKRATYFQQIANSHYFGQWLAADNQPEALLTALDSVKSEDFRRRFAFACFTERGLRELKNPDAFIEEVIRYANVQSELTGTLIAVGLLSRNDKVGESVSQLDLTRCLRGDVSEAVQIARDDVAWDRKREHWQNLIARLKPSYARQNPDLASKFWKNVISSKKGPRADIAVALLKTAWFVPQLREQKLTEDLLKDLKVNFRDWNLRSCVAQYAQSPAIVIELESGSIEFFVKLLDTLDPKDADHVGGYIAQYANLKAWFATSKQPEKILAALDSIKDQSRRERFASSFFRSGFLGGQPENKELLPKVIAYSKRHSEEFQMQLAISLLTAYRTERLAAQTDLPQFLVSQFESVDFDSDHLYRMIRSGAVCSIFEKKQLLRDVIDKVFAMKEPESRLKCFSALLESRTFQTQLTDDEISKIFSFAQQQDADVLASLLRKQPYLVQRLAELGKYDIARQMALGGNEIATPGMRWSFYLNGAVIAQQRARKQKPHDLVSLLRDRDARSVEMRLRELGRHKEAAKWIFESYGWKPFADALQRLPENRRQSVAMSIFQQHGFITELSKTENFAALLKEGDFRTHIVHQGGYLFLLRSPDVRKQLEPQFFMQLVREGYERSSQSNKNLAARSLRSLMTWEPGIRSGNGKWLLKAFRENPRGRTAKEQREYRAKDLADPRGELVFAIRLGELDLAEKMLSEFVDDDLGCLRLVRFQMHRQLVEEATGKEFAPSTSFEELLQQNDRLAAYWARSQNDYSTAIKLAKQLPDPGLGWAFALESHDWARLKDMQVCRTSELPLQPKNLAINPIHRRIEQLGYIAAVKQISGDTGASTKQLGDWVLQNASSKNTPRYGADALLSVGEIDTALALLDDKAPTRSFYWHRYRLDYGKALEVLDWKSANAKSYFDKLAGPNADHKKRVAIAKYMIQIAILARDAGMPEHVKSITQAILDYADNAKLTEEARDFYLREIAVYLFSRGFPSESQHAIVNCKRNETLHLYLSSVYHDNKFSAAASEANVWLGEFARRHPKETRLEHLIRVDGAMSAKTPLDQLRPFPDRSDDMPGSGVPVTRYRYKLYDQAVEVVESRTRRFHSDYVLIGQARLSQKRYADAAEAFYSAFALSTADLTRLYLAGHCWELAGKSEKANELKFLARTLAVSHEVNHGLAIGLTREGLTQDAMEIYRTLIHNAPPGHATYIQTLGHLATDEEDPQEAVDKWSEYVLHYMRPIQFYYDTDVWLQSEFNLHAARATLACEKNEFKEASKHWQKAVSVNPTDVSSTKRFVSVLQTKNQNGIADRITKKQNEYLQSRRKQFPNSQVIVERLKDAASSDR